MERFLWLAYATGLSRWRCDRLCVEVTTCKTCCYSLRLLNDIRAVLSWHPVGSMDPDAVAFFALDEIAM
ncbi:hypothetical protein JHK87_047775 [Glycine soja]|nr:hypothetical protein JHK86_047979 [Glycine max]KAG4933773.1 hypothetical protein JHK87_047775 [Glycine soja]